MCPQLASNMKWHGNYAFGNDLLLTKPELASWVAAVIAGWSTVEAQLGRTFAVLIGAKHPVAMGMYTTARSAEMRLDLLLTVARETLPRRYALIFVAALR